MLVSTKGRYALRFLLDLAQNSKDGPVPLKDIAERQNVSKKYLERIVAQLGPSGMFNVARGYQGGYQLVRDPRLISVAEILVYTEGGFEPVPAEEYENDIASYAWQKLEGAITRCLENISLQDILDYNARMAEKADKDANAGPAPEEPASASE